MASKTTQQREQQTPQVIEGQNDLLPARREEPKGIARYEEDAGAGFEDFTQDDLAIPFLGILQKSSPQVEDGNPAQLPGARAGMIFNNVTREFVDGKDGIVFIPVHRVHDYAEWIPRDAGGGLAGRHAVDSAIVRDAIAKAGSPFGDLVSPDGNDLQETFTVFGLVIDRNGATSYAVIAFASTQIKHFKRWMTIARSQLIEGSNKSKPMFAHRYRLRSQFEQNKKGSWYGWDISFDGGNAQTALLPETDPLYAMAKGFRDMVVSGAAKPVTVERDAAAPRATDTSDPDRF